MHLFRDIAVAALLVVVVIVAGINGPTVSLAFNPPDIAEVLIGIVDHPPVVELRQPADRATSGSPTIGEGAADAAAIAPVWVSSPFSGPVSNPALANFGVINEGIVYRSAQPTEEGYRWLRSQGFKSVVSFRRESGSNRAEVLGRGFRNSLWLDIEDETDPSDQQAERFLAFVNDSNNWPILIHCKIGVGRTGTMAALIRYAIDGWSMEEAMAEAKAYRGGVQLVQPQVDWLARWAANHPPASHRPANWRPAR